MGTFDAATQDLLNEPKQASQVNEGECIVNEGAILRLLYCCMLTTICAGDYTLGKGSSGWQIGPFPCESERAAWPEGLELGRCTFHLQRVHQLAQCARPAHCPLPSVWERHVCPDLVDPPHQHCSSQSVCARGHELLPAMRRASGAGCPGRQFVEMSNHRLGLLPTCCSTSGAGKRAAAGSPDAGAAESS